MHLLLDIGNSNLKWGLHDGNAILESGHVAVDSFADANLASINPEEKSIQHIAAANVADDAVTSRLNTLIANRFGMPVNFITTRSQAQGVKCAYENPQQLGVDRWAAIIAAWQQNKKPVVVVDCGTAITVDAVDASGKHLGGWIAPGRFLMQDTLVQNASRISTSKGDLQIEPATKTSDAVFSGSAMAAIGFIDGAIKKLQSGNNKYHCLITGGDAEFLVEHLSGDFKHLPHLVLEGVMLLAGEKQ